MRRASLSLMDRQVLDRIAEGREPVTARLDLHGLTEAEAHARLEDFVERAAQNSHRLVLVITGKGRDGEGALRRLVPLWLESSELRPLVRAAHPAHPQHGGEGALYLWMKK